MKVPWSKFVFVSQFYQSIKKKRLEMYFSVTVYKPSNEIIFMYAKTILCLLSFHNY